MSEPLSDRATPPHSQPEYLTVPELAALLRIKERKVYALAAAGEIPVSKATGRLLFPRDAIEAWVERQTSGQRPSEGLVFAGAEPPAIVVGSHDPLLEWSLRASRSGLASLFDGSLDGLTRFQRGEAVASGLHLFDDASCEWNRAVVADCLADRPIVLIEWAWRQRGLIVAPEVAGDIHTIGDLAGRTVVRRQAEAGSQRLLMALLTKAALASAKPTSGEADKSDPTRRDIEALAIRWTDDIVRTEMDVAAPVADGEADAAFGLACVAQRFRLPFVPVLRERYDLVVHRRSYFEPSFQALLAFCRTAEFGVRAEALRGYDVGGVGRVHFNGR